MIKFYAIFAISTHSLQPYPIVIDGYKRFEKEVCEEALDIVMKDLYSGAYGKVPNIDLACLPVEVRGVENAK